METWTWTANLEDQGLGEDRAVHAGVVPADHVEPAAAVIVSPLCALTITSRRPSIAG